MSYFAFIRAEYRFLLFGFLMMGLSNFGQTFFISLYSAYFRDTFTLTNTQFGGIYSGVTLASAVCLLYSGKLIDRWRLPVFAGTTLVGLALACLITFLADELWMLALGLFMLRHFGQGLSSHTGMTATGRAYEKNRGRATALVQLGYAGFEGFFPVMAITLMALFGWQQSWLVFGLFLALVALPLLVFLSRFEPLPKETADDEPTPRSTGRMCCAIGVSIWCCRFMLRHHFCSRACFSIKLFWLMNAAGLWLCLPARSASMQA